MRTGELTILNSIVSWRWREIWPYFALIPPICLNLYWAASDCSVWPWDQAWYGEVSVDLWYILVHQFQAWPSAMVHAFGSKAPGLAWIGQCFVPIGEIFQSIEFGLLLFIILTQFATLVLTYHIGWELCPDSKLIPLAGCAFVASAPLFVGLSHQYVTEPLQLFAVTYFYWIAMRAQRLGSWNILVHLMFATSLAMLAKASSPLYCALPGLIAAVYGLKSFISAPRDTMSHLAAKVPLVCGGLMALGSTVIWYAVNFEHVRRFVKLASSSEFALDYGKEDIFVNKLLYWLSALRQSFFLPNVLLLLGFIVLMVVVVSCVRIVDGKHLPRFHPCSLVVLAAALHLVVVLIVLSLNINEESRYLLPLLPSLVIILISCISLAQSRFLRVSFVFLVVLQFSSVHAQALGIGEIDYSRMSVWLKTFTRDKEPMIEMKRLIHLTSNTRTDYRYHICGVEYPWLNFNSLSFYAAKARLKTNLRCYYTSLGYAEKDMSKAWRRLESLKIIYFISVKEGKQPEPPNFVNKASLPVLRRIREDDRFVLEPFESKLGVIVFRNAQELPE